jgi:hypothetical protein
MKCRNKREQLSEQVYMSFRTMNMVSEQIRTRVEHIIIMVRTRYYYSRTTYYYSGTSLYVISNKTKKSVRTTVRTKSYYSRNNFVCYLEQK